MLELSEEAKRLTSIFLSYRNDIDIYTEDENKDKEFYKTLFKRLLKPEIVINDITPLGSRDSVINRCANEPQNNRKKIFIIDGDISIIHGNVPVLKDLFVLDAYCIENFLFEKEAILQFIYLNCAIKSKEYIEHELDFENWLTQYSQNFIDLFIHFAIADYVGLRYTLFNAYKYHVKKENEYCLDPTLIHIDMNDIKERIINASSEIIYNELYEQLVDKWSKSVTNLFTIVSGKDYLIPILSIKTQVFKQSKMGATLEEIKMALIQYCQLDRLESLKVLIEQL